MAVNLGSIAPATAGTLKNDINFTDGTGSPANASSLAVSLYAAGSNTAITTGVTLTCNNNTSARFRLLLKANCSDRREPGIFWL